jgi:hypothetical protein
MAKLAPKKQGFDKNSYWNGVFTGVFIGSFFICITALFFIKIQGLQVAINPEQLAKLVQVKVQSEVRRDIPQILEDIKNELPQEIPNHLEELDGLTIGFGNSQIKLPPEVITTIKTEFNRIFEAAIMNTLNNYNTLTYEERIGMNAYEMVDSVLKQEIIGKTYIIKSSQWFSVPVKIVGSTKNQFQIGI